MRGTLDTLAFDAAEVTIVGEHDYAVRAHLIAREPIELDRGRGGALPPAAARPVRPLPARAARRGRTAQRQQHRRGGPHGRRVGPPLGGDRVAAPRPSSTAARSSARESRTRPATSPASSGSRPAGHRAGGQRALEDLARLLRAGRGPPRRPGRRAARVLRATINLTRIESRPLRQGLGRYMFFCDLEGPATEPLVAEAIEALLRTRAESVRILGSYPVARYGRGPAWSRRRPLQFRAMARVLVLNATYEPINVCTLRRAAVLAAEGKGRAARAARAGRPALRAHDDGAARRDPPRQLRADPPRGPPPQDHPPGRPRPRLLDLPVLRLDQVGPHRRPRDPRSRGGKSVWENIVAACATCNRRKGNRLPREIQMHPRKSPRAPGPTVFIQVASPKIPAAWQQYLPQAA